MNWPLLCAVLHTCIADFKAPCSFGSSQAIILRYRSKPLSSATLLTPSGLRSCSCSNSFPSPDSPAVTVMNGAAGAAPPATVPVVCVWGKLLVTSSTSSSMQITVLKVQKGSHTAISSLVRLHLGKWAPLLWCVNHADIDDWLQLVWRG